MSATVPGEPSEQVFSELAGGSRMEPSMVAFGSQMLNGLPAEYRTAASVRVIAAALCGLDPRAKACLKLAALSDEELVERVAQALLSGGEFGDHVPPDEREQIRAEAYVDARAVLAALGLPTTEEESHAT